MYIGRAKETYEEREKGGKERGKSVEKEETEIRRGGGGGNLSHRWTRYRYITRLEWCACKRVKRRDIFYIYEYLPLLCSRAGGLWRRANRELTSLSPSFSHLPSLISFPLRNLSPRPSSSHLPSSALASDTTPIEASLSFDRRHIREFLSLFLSLSL